MSDVIKAGCGLVIVALGAFWYVNGGDEVIQDWRWQRSLKKWVVANVADPKAELISISKPEQILGGTYRLARVRALNPLGGPMIMEMMLLGEKPDTVKVITQGEFMGHLKGLNATSAELDHMKAGMERMWRKTDS